MKHTPHIRQFRHAHCKQARFNKGIAPILIALIVALIAGGGYAVVKTNPKIAQKLGIEKQVEKKELIADKKDAKKDETIKGLSFDFDNGSTKCDKYTQRTNADGNPAQFQTSAPRNNKSNIESGYDTGIRNKFGTSKDVYDYTVSIQQPDATIATSSGRMTSDKFDSVNFPKDFAGSKVMEGLYSIVFKIENEVVACDGFEIVASDWKTYTNEKYGFELQYPSAWPVLEYDSAAPNDHVICFNKHARPADECDAIVLVMRDVDEPQIQILIKGTKEAYFYAYPVSNTWRNNGFVFFVGAKKENQLLSTFKFTK